MANKCYVHIGMHKTGSSSIQETFCGEKFKSSKIKYFPILGPNHGVGFKKLFPHIRSNEELKKLKFESSLSLLKENTYIKREKIVLDRKIWHNNGLNNLNYLIISNTESINAALS